MKRRILMALVALCVSAGFAFAQGPGLTPAARAKIEAERVRDAEALSGLNTSNNLFQLWLTGLNTSNNAFQAWLTGLNTSNNTFQATDTGLNTSNNLFQSWLTGLNTSNNAFQAWLTGVNTSNDLFQAWLTGLNTSNNAFQAWLTGVNLTNSTMAILSNDATNRYYHEYIGTFGGSGVSTQTWPFVAAVKPLVPIAIYSGLSGPLAATNHIVYDYSASDTTQAIFYGEPTQSYAGHVHLKR